MLDRGVTQPLLIASLKISSNKSASGSTGLTRVTVLVAGDKYSFMKKETADLFGFKIENEAKGTSGRLIRGSSGAGSIKLIGASGTKSIPIPSGVTIAQTKEFLATATKNKPTGFVT